MKTIKIIDLLIKKANGEEVPEKIKFRNVIYGHYERIDGNFNYKEIINGKYGKYYLCDRYFIENILNDEVEIIEEEIIEEEKQLPEIIHWHEENGVGNVDDAFYVDVNDKSQYVDSEYDSWEMTVILKINEIIEYLASKEKGDK